MTNSEPGGLRTIPDMGVIYVVAEAMKLGYYNGHPEWCGETTLVLFPAIAGPQKVSPRSLPN